jgi:hypothetical protein
MAKHFLLKVAEFSIVRKMTAPRCTFTTQLVVDSYHEIR